MHQMYDYKQFSILFVDDENKTCKYFDKAFSDEFRVITASDVDEALQILDEKGNEVGVLITDQRMPGKNGVELLRHVRKSQPHIVRMLTTAYSDLDIAIDAVNDGEIIRYITKPWDIKNLRGELSHAMEFFLVQNQRDLLLKEKLSIWQRLMQVNLSRDLLAMGSGLSNVRYPLHAINAFIEQNPFMGNNFQLPKPANLQHFDLWDFIQNETQKIIDLAGHINNVFNSNEKNENEQQTINVNDLLNEACNSIADNLKGISIELNIDKNIKTVKSNKDLLLYLFESLILQSINSHEPGDTIIISAKDQIVENDTLGIQVTLGTKGAQRAASKESISNHGQSLPNEMTELLTAFIICYHHSGKIAIKRDGASGLGFEVQLPLDPLATTLSELNSNWLSNIFDQYENIED